MGMTEEEKFTDSASCREYWACAFSPSQSKPSSTSPSRSALISLPWWQLARACRPAILQYPVPVVETTDSAVCSAVIVELCPLTEFNGSSHTVSASQSGSWGSRLPGYGQTHGWHTASCRAVSIIAKRASIKLYEHERDLSGGRPCPTKQTVGHQESEGRRPGCNPCILSNRRPGMGTKTAYSRE
ncbi:hypothetical protein BaRGS_00026299, partial [Batillaria attramentaria]